MTRGKAAGCVITYRALIVSLLVGTAHAADSKPLAEMPKEGEIPFGVSVYVDDRKCPKGEIKEVIGGSREKNVARQVRCVPRPPRASAQ